MQFSYEYCKSNTFTWPLIACVVFGISVVVLVREMFTNSKGFWQFHNVKLLIVLIVFLFVLTINILHLSYGYKIVLDEKDDVVTFEGEITKIEEAFFSPMYKLDEGNSKGHLVYISDEKYYIMCANNLEVGDIVEITYLENSKVIIEINKKAE